MKAKTALWLVRFRRYLAPVVLVAVTVVVWLVWLR
jgi:hypothetical protein